MHKLEDLKIWTKAITLAKEVDTILKDLPVEEIYGLTSQIRRSAVSIAANIAEGAGRNSKRGFIQFLSIANGSAYDLQKQLILANELELLDKFKVDIILNQLTEIQKMNYSFQKTVQS